jgi:gliding motility-associated-like protein
LPYLSKKRISCPPLAGIRRSAWLFLIFLASILPLNAQKQSSIWYFGRNAGLDFRGFDPVPLADGQTNSVGGVASICDSTGQVLFYTDGKTVWNSNHGKVFTNDLSGNPESTQAATIVPDPAADGQYYVFTTKPFNSNSTDNSGGNYYIIQIGPGGTGQIIFDYSSTNQNRGLFENTTEKLVAIPYIYGQNKTGYWFLMHEFNSDRFYKAKLDSSGFQIMPPQNIGSVHQNDTIDDGTNRGAQGQMKVNDQGTKIALAVTGGKFFEVFNFRTTDGRLSNPLKIPAGDQGNLNGYYYGAYGVEFSPTGNYATVFEPTSGNYLYGSTRDGAYVYQWNLAEMDNLQLVKSGKVLFNNPEFEAGSLQIAPNGKIYVAFKGQDYLGVINSPKRPKPLCKFEEFGASLVNSETGEGGKSQLGLPATFSKKTNPEPFYFENLCFGDETVLYLTNQSNITQGSLIFVITYLGTGVPVKTLQPTAPTGVYDVKYRFPKTGTYKVLLNLMRGGVRQQYTRMLTINPLPVVTLYPKDTIPLCNGSVVHLDAGIHSFYEWEDPSIRVRERDVSPVQTDPYDYNREYRVRVKDNTGCIGWDTVWIQKKILPVIDSTASIRAFCGQQDGAAIVYPRGDPNRFEFLWEHNRDERSNRLNGLSGGDYVVHVISKTNGCEVTDTIHVDELGGSSVKLNYGGKTVCQGVPITLTVTGSSEFKWVKPEAFVGKGDSVTIVLTEDMVFEVDAISRDEGRECTNKLRDTVRVYPAHKPEIGADRTGCKGDTIWVEAPEPYAGWTWSNGFEGRVNPVTEEASPLVLFAEDENKCIFTDTLTVHFKPKPEVNLGRDRTECSRDPVVLTGGTGDTYEWSTGDRSREISVNQNDKYYVKITADGCFASDTVNLRINNPDRLKIDSLKVKDISCFGNGDGEIRIKADGDGLTYLYSINNGATFQDPSAFLNLPAGVNYRVTVWEDSACMVSYPLPVTIVEPALIEAKSCINPPSCPECKDGNITLSNIKGGTPPYKFWLNAAEADPDIQGLGPGNYTVTITDKNLCSWTTTVNMVAGTNVHIVPSTDEPVCPGTAVTLTVVNGSEVEWISPSGIGAATVVRPLQTTTYKAASTKRENDGFTCTIVAEYTVQVIPYDKPDLGEDISACEGDTVPLTAGDGYLNWSWNTGATTRDISLYKSMDPVIVFVTDPSHCLLSDTIAVRYFKYPEVNLGEDQSRCTNQPIILSGGTGDSYLWSTGAEVQQISVSQTAIYRLVITKDGCSKSDEISVKILNPDLLQIDSPSVKDNTCFESGDGSIEIHARGEGTLYEYSIDDGSSWQTSPLFENLAADENFRIRVREDSLCTAEYPEPIAVTQPEKIQVKYRLKSPTCLGCSDGQIIIKEITGGVAPFTVSVAGVETSLTITDLAENTYTVVVIDSRLCSTSVDIKIDMNNVIPNVFTPNGDQINDKWIIPLLEYYPEGQIQIFDGSGRGVRFYAFTEGYNNDPWDGKNEQGSAVPMGTYYYVLNYLDPEDGMMQLTGWVMVMK